MGESPAQTTVTQEYTKWAKGRIVIAYWLLGMCNNYIYVIMLSAAHDVISKVENEVKIIHVSEAIIMVIKVSPACRPDERDDYNCNSEFPPMQRT